MPHSYCFRLSAASGRYQLNSSIIYCIAHERKTEIREQLKD